MKQSLKALHKHMDVVEDRISQVKKTIESQPDMIKREIRDITHDFVQNYIIKSLDQDKIQQQK